MRRNATVGYHGHCFDGMCSAAVVTRLLREVESTELCFRYIGFDHQPGGSHVPEAELDGDVNVVVDFRYSASPKLHWWFDHHVSGIASEAERAAFERESSGTKFFDPSYGSCCKLIADVARERFGVSLDDMRDTIAWADVIDAARFESARDAVLLDEPALQLMTVIESHGDDAFLAPRIEALAAGTSLADLAADPQVQRLFAPLAEHNRATVEAIRRQARCEQGVVFFDLVGSGSDRYNKFIPYYLFPQARYAVAVSAGSRRAKVSVGSNPWAPVPRTHDIARLCERYGGGGHPVVGAVSLEPDQVDRARQIAREIIEQLQR